MLQAISLYIITVKYIISLIDSPTFFLHPLAKRANIRAYNDTYATQIFNAIYLKRPHFILLAHNKIIKQWINIRRVQNNSTKQNISIEPGRLFYE